MAEREESSGYNVLAGVKVLDWTEGVAGPYACQMLADLGADVIKVERPQGDWSRTSGPGTDRGQHHFRALNRNKRTILLDLRHEDGLGVAHRLIERADIMVTAYRPGVTERLGTGYEQAREINPSLIYVRVSAYGYRGPLAGRPGSDTILQAVSGLMSQIGEPASDPQRVGVPVIDFIASRDAVIGALCGLLARRAGGKSSGPVDVSLFASAATLQSQLWQSYFDTGAVPIRTGNRNASLAPAGLYETGDGRHIAVAVLRDEHFRKLCSALSLDGLADDPRFSTNGQRLAHREELEALVAPVIASRPFDEWLELLEHEDVLVGPVTDLLDIDQDAAFRGSLPVVEVMGATGMGRAIGLPLRFEERDLPASSPAPSLGTHTEEILGEIGYDPGEIARLIATGVTPRGVVEA